MNIVIANRLVNLRKENNLSQEALAEKLGISRQAVSKWERAEASPDTDNLILLARLYEMTLDELLRTEISSVEIVEDNRTQEQGKFVEGNLLEENKEQTEANKEEGEYVQVGLGGIHVKDRDGSEVHVGWNGIHVKDKKNSHDNVDIDKNGVYINGEKYEGEWIGKQSFPFDIIVVVAYIIIGITWNAWHPGWLIFFAIPLVHSFLSAIKNRNMHIFAYPVLATLIYFILGFYKGMWHPGWVVFLTIPVYYSLVAYIQGLVKRKE